MVQLKEHVLDLRHRRLVDLLVDADGRQRREEIWVNVRVRGCPSERRAARHWPRAATSA